MSYGASESNRMRYISPEQTGRIEKKVDYRSDLYSLGATFYHMLAGFPPFTVHADEDQNYYSPGSLRAMQTGTVPEPSRAVGNVSAGAEDFPDPSVAALDEQAKQVIAHFIRIPEALSSLFPWTDEGSTSDDLDESEYEAEKDFQMYNNDGIPPPLSELIEKLLEKSPRDRYQSCQGLLYDLKYLQSLLIPSMWKNFIDCESSESSDSTSSKADDNESPLYMTLNQEEEKQEERPIDAEEEDAEAIEETSTEEEEARRANAPRKRKHSYSKTKSMNRELLRQVTIGRRDACGILQIPDKVYNRQKEMIKIAEAVGHIMNYLKMPKKDKFRLVRTVSNPSTSFSSSSSSSLPSKNYTSPAIPDAFAVSSCTAYKEVVIVTGVSGVGKTYLVKSALKKFVSPTFDPPSSSEESAIESDVSDELSPFGSDDEDEQSKPIVFGNVDMNAIGDMDETSEEEEEEEEEESKVTRVKKEEGGEEKAAEAMHEKLLEEEEEEDVLLKSGLEWIKGRASVPNLGNVYNTPLQSPLPVRLLTSKCNQYSSPNKTPFGDITSAFRSWVRSLLKLPASTVSRWQEHFAKRLGSNTTLLMNFIPELQLLLGPAKGIVVELSTTEQQIKFESEYRLFLSAMGEGGVPILLFVDDAQWMDRGSFDFLGNVLLHCDVPILIIMSYRTPSPPVVVIGESSSNDTEKFKKEEQASNEERNRNPVKTESGLKTAPGRLNQSININELPMLNHPKKEEVIDIVEFIAEFESNLVNSSIIELVPPSVEGLTEMVVDTLKAKKEKCKKLAAVLKKKTNGNMFYIQEFLKCIVHQRLLVFDYENGAWTWDLEGIDSARFMHNMVHLVVERFTKQPVHCQSLLQLASCIGSTFTISQLAKVTDSDPKVIESVLWQAVHDDILIKTDESEGQYSFSHDQVQQALTDTISSRHFVKLNLMIGRKLLSAEHIEIDPASFGAEVSFERSNDPTSSSSYTSISTTRAIPLTIPKIVDGVEFTEVLES